MKNKKYKKIIKHSKSVSSSDGRQPQKHRTKHKRQHYIRNTQNQPQCKKQQPMYTNEIKRQNSQQNKKRVITNQQNSKWSDRLSYQNNDKGWESEQNISQKIKEKQIKHESNFDAQKKQKVKEQPNFQPSGILLQFYNSRQGVSLKFHEPTEAHKPTEEWRIYPFRDDGTPINPIILKQSCYLIGKDERICDILCQNSSISRQHAVIQFRIQYKRNIDDTYQTIVKPYLMDLQSTNGTTLNSEQLQPSRYYELLNKDVLKFGLSTREYLMFKVPDQSLDCQT